MKNPTAADLLELAVANAIEAHDFEAVTDILGALAVEAPDRAQAVLETIRTGIRLSGGTP